MGQGSFQSVPQIIAEELEVDLNQVNIVFRAGKSDEIWKSDHGRKFYDSWIV